MDCATCHAQPDVWDSLGRCGTRPTERLLPVLMGPELTRCPVAAALNHPEVLVWTELVPISERRVLTAEGDMVVVAGQEGLRPADLQWTPKIRGVLRFAEALRIQGARAIRGE